MKIEKPEIIVLKKAVEATIPRKKKAPYDFNYLVGAIAERCKEMLSETTLKQFLEDFIIEKFNLILIQLIHINEKVHPLFLLI